MLMLSAVIFQPIVARLHHQLLLALKVHAREFDQAIKQLAQLFPPGAADYGKTQLIHGVHQDAVLIVHGANTNAAGMVPGKQSHMSLH
jgi:hypothetical protein